jgi:hypothetical protein
MNINQLLISLINLTEESKGHRQAIAKSDTTHGKELSSC